MYFLNLSLSLEYVFCKPIFVKFSSFYLNLKKYIVFVNLPYPVFYIWFLDFTTFGSDRFSCQCILKSGNFADIFCRILFVYGKGHTNFVF